MKIINRQNKYIIIGTLKNLVPLLILVSIIVFFIVSVKNKAENRLYLHSERDIVDLQIEGIQEGISNVIGDLKFLSSSSSFKSFLTSRDNKLIKRKINNDFLVFSKNHELYDQIRFIDTLGMEVLRINYNKGEPEIISGKKLQNKKNRYYFKDAIGLDENDIFISPLDLNIENGKLEILYKPMIRFAVPVYDYNQKKQGILIFNYLGSHITNNSEKDTNNLINNQIMVLNSESYWLKGSSTENEWAFMFKDKKNIKFSNSYPNEWKVISDRISGQFETNKGLFTFKTIYPVRGNRTTRTVSFKANSQSSLLFNASHYYWKVVSFVPSNILHKQQNTNLKYAIYTVISIFSILLIVFWRVNKFRYLQKIAQTKLRESEEKLKAITENAQDAIFLIDNNNTIEFWNNSAEKMFGYTANEVIGKKLPSLIIPQNYHEQFNKRLIVFQQSETVKSINKTWELNALRKNGEEFPTEASLGVVSIHNQHHAIGIIRDVSKRKASETALKKSREEYKKQSIELIELNSEYLILNKELTSTNEELQTINKKLTFSNEKLNEANATKDRFISILAHDLKNPFTTLIGFSDLLSKNIHRYEMEKIIKFVKTINTTSKQTFNLLNNLLEWSRSQRNKIPFKTQQTNLYNLIYDSYLFLNSIANAKEIEIKLDIPKEIEVIADSEMIKTVIRNLVSNAIKFTDKNGRIEISAKKNTNTININITDTGTGMNEKTKKSLFKIGETKSIQGTNGERGTGFGLLLCKEFIDKHKGKIEVESELGKGSKFIITLPIKQNNKLIMSD